MSCIRITIVGLLTFFSISLYGQGMINYLIADAQAGDGTLSMLNRFGVNSNCNSQHFSEINQLDAKQGLVKGKPYKLPIIIYQYNGKSIRTTLGISDLPQAQRIQAFNEALHQAGIKKGDYRQDRELWVPYHEFTCPEEQIEINVNSTPKTTPASKHSKSSVPNPNEIKSTKSRVSFDIFGPKYKDVPYRSDRLKGALYYIVSGHGGPDPGATSKRGKNLLCEDEYAYDIGLRLAHYLISHGAICYLVVRDHNDGIRDASILPPDKDEIYFGDIPISSNQKERLQTRSTIINKLTQENQWRNIKYQRAVFLHIDSDKRSQRQDVFFYHTIGNKESKQLANTLLNTLQVKYKQYQQFKSFTGFVKERDLHMLRETDPTSVFIELGNIRNYSDQQRFLKSSNRDLIAAWLTEGLLIEKGNNKK